MKIIHEAYLPHSALQPTFKATNEQKKLAEVPESDKKFSFSSKYKHYKNQNIQLKYKNIERIRLKTSFPRAKSWLLSVV